MSPRARRLSIPLYALLSLSACDNDDHAPADAGAIADASAGTTVTEKPLDVSLELLTVGDGGVTSVVIPGAGDPNAPSPTILKITTRDQLTPVRTDLWLYTLVGGQLQELDAFSGTTGRKTGRLMLPATIGGKPSGLVPADDGRLNGLMTDNARGSLAQGAFVSAIDGTVQVTLKSAPSDPIVVLAGVEDQRYAGAAVINPDGTAGTVPSGVGAPETHERRSYATDVAPILQVNCIKACHNTTSNILTASLYPMSTLDDLVNNNFALGEQTADCQAKYPNDQTALEGCIQAITQAQYLVEPGAPALSDLLQRARPDEMASVSTLGLVWYGGGNPKSRYNATYGDRRMPSTTTSLDSADWNNAPTYFDLNPNDYQVLFDWIAQGAQP